jgi:hypothetical protein
MKIKKIIPIMVLLGVLFLGTSSIEGMTTNNEALKFATKAYEPPLLPWTNVENGSRVNISAGFRHQLRIQNGTLIRLHVNESVQLQLNVCDQNSAGPLPNKTRAMHRYMHIELNHTIAMNATMFCNYTFAEIGDGNVSTYRWAFFNTETYQWEYAFQNWIEHTPTGATVYCNTTHFSLWTILASEETANSNPVPGTPFNSQNGTAFSLQAGNQYQIKTQHGFSLQLQMNKSVAVTITEYETSPKVMTQARHQIKTQTMAIELNESAEINAQFSYTFTNQIRNQLGIKNMEKLKFMFFNESINTWETPKNQWIQGDTLFCNTTHFSLWTIAEEESVSATPGFTIIPLLFALVPIFILKRRK